MLSLHDFVLSCRHSKSWSFLEVYVPIKVLHMFASTLNNYVPLLASLLAFLITKKYPTTVYLYSKGLYVQEVHNFIERNQHCSSDLLCNPQF